MIVELQDEYSVRATPECFSTKKQVLVQEKRRMLRRSWKDMLATVQRGMVAAQRSISEAFRERFSDSIVSLLFWDDV